MNTCVSTTQLNLKNDITFTFEIFLCTSLHRFLSSHHSEGNPAIFYLIIPLLVFIVSPNMLASVNNILFRFMFILCIYIIYTYHWWLAEDPGLIPESGRSPGEGNGNPLQYSCLENSMDRGAWQAMVQGVEKSQTCLSD